MGCPAQASRRAFTMASPTLEIDLLRSFVAISEMGSFTAAAGVMHRTQSAISLQVRRLEAQAGVRLFVRQGRETKLTAEGRDLLVQARRLLRLHDETVASLQKPAVTGTVRVAIPDDYALVFLPGLFLRFSEAFPQVDLEVTTLGSAQIQQGLEAGDYDLVVMSQAIQTPDAVVLREEPVVWVTAPGSLASEQRPVPVAHFSYGCLFMEAAAETLLRGGIAFRVMYRSNSVTALLAAVESGLAVSALVASTVPSTLLTHDSLWGLPPLPTVKIVLRTAPGGLGEAGTMLARHIVDGFGIHPLADTMLARTNALATSR